MPSIEARSAEPSRPPGSLGPSPLHRAFEILEDAAAFAAHTRDRLQLLAGRLVEMQRLAEKVADAPGEVESREVAFAKIAIFAQQCDAIARRPVYQGVPVLEGGRYAFEPGRELDPLVLEVDDLRSRGEGSLGLFEHVDGHLAVVGAGGAVLAGQEAPLPDPAPGELGPERLPEGEYEIELVYLASDASIVRLRLLPLDDGPALATIDELDLSAEGPGVEVDLGNGLALILDRVAAAARVDIDHRTRQPLTWRHEAGERMCSLEGWFHETVQPRDFELYALFLEQPLGRVKAVLDRLARFEVELDAAASALIERLEGASSLRPDPGSGRTSLGPEVEVIFDHEALREALVEEV